MFQETLLESSPASPRRRRWPMATAFTFQMLVAGALVAVPLLSAGVIPLTSPSMPVPISYDKPAAEPHDRRPAGGPATGHPVHVREIVTMSGAHPKLTWGEATRGKESSDPDPRPCFDSHCVDNPTGPPKLFSDGPTIVPKRPDGPVRMSRMDPGMLINRVVPEYPTIAVHSGIQGEVKLHAIIARDGTIQSLSVISGHPMLIRAAMDAVQQWKYRPYVLNGEPVEVDTYITVNFKKSN
jgi:protein TonB